MLLTCACNPAGAQSCPATLPGEPAAAGSTSLGSLQRGSSGRAGVAAAMSGGGPGTPPSPPGTGQCWGCRSAAPAPAHPSFLLWSSRLDCTTPPISQDPGPWEPQLLALLPAQHWAQGCHHPQLPRGPSLQHSHGEVTGDSSGPRLGGCLPPSQPALVSRLLHREFPKLQAHSRHGPAAPGSVPRRAPASQPAGWVLCKANRRTSQARPGQAEKASQADAT